MKQYEMNRRDVIKLSGTAIAAISTVSLNAETKNESSDWNQFRGPNRDNKSIEKGILKVWDGKGPTLLWTSKNNGVGYSSLSNSADKLVTMGSFANKEFVICLDTSGKELWKQEIGTLYENSFGNGPRSTPTIDGDNYYALSGQGNFICGKLSDGSILWKCSMLDFNGELPKWGYSASPLVDGKKVIISCGGVKGIVLALDKTNGKKIWQSSDFKGEDAQYSSIQKINCNGKDMYMKFTVAKVAGIDIETGKTIWQAEGIGKSAACATPIYADGYVFLSQGYFGGALCHKINKDFTTTQVYKTKALANHHGGLVYLDGYIYGHDNKKGWTCQNLKTGEILWHDKTADKGSVIFCDGLLFCYTETKGEVIITEPSTKGWKEKGRFKIPQHSANRKKDRIWAHPVISRGKLYLRDQEYIFCYDIKN